MHKITTAAVAGVLLVPASSAALGAAASGGAVATYDGKTIDLSEGWQGAHACLVVSTAEVRCYDTEREMRDSLVAAARRAVPTDQVAPSIACSGGGNLVTLYADVSMGGNSLSFVSTSGWVNLAPFGFDNDMESWVNQTPCAAVVADGTGGSSAQLTLAAHSSSSSVGSTWKNRASSINVSP